MKLLAALLLAAAPFSGDSPQGVAQRWVYRADYSNGNTAITVTSGKTFLVMIQVINAGQAVGVGILTPQAGSAGGSATVGLYGPVPDATTWTCTGATLVASSVDTAQSVTVGRAWYVPFTTTPTIQPGRYCVAVEVQTGVLITRGSNFWGFDDGQTGFFTQTYGALPSTAPTVTASNSDMPSVALRMQ